jgi:hypothetical protein
VEPELLLVEEEVISSTTGGRAGADSSDPPLVGWSVGGLEGLHHGLADTFAVGYLVDYSITAFL